MPLAGANGSTTVTTDDGCAWTAVSRHAVDHRHRRSAAVRAAVQVNFTVAPSTATSQRLGTLTIAGPAFT